MARTAQTQFAAAKIEARPTATSTSEEESYEYRGREIADSKVLGSCCEEGG